MKYFPAGGTGAESVQARRDKMWEMKLGFIPIAKFDMVCPVCHSEDIQLGGVSWTEHHIQKPEDRVTLPYRVAARYKCRQCSLELHFGIPITSEEYAEAKRRGLAEVEVRWRHIAELVEKGE